MQTEVQAIIKSHNHDNSPAKIKRLHMICNMLHTLIHPELWERKYVQGNIKIQNKLTVAAFSTTIVIDNIANSAIAQSIIDVLQLTSFNCSLEILLQKREDVYVIKLSRNLDQLFDQLTQWMSCIEVVQRKMLIAFIYRSWKRIHLLVNSFRKKIDVLQHTVETTSSDVQLENIRDKIDKLLIICATKPCPKIEMVTMCDIDQEWLNDLDDMNDNIKSISAELNSIQQQ